MQKKEDDWSDLSGPGSLYYFALVVHGADHFLIDQLAVIVQLSKRLGPNSIFVSLVDYSSSDSTPFICDMAEAVMILLGISFRIRQVPSMTSDPTASYYPLEEAYTRNLALEPLIELWTRRKVRFTRVIWLKGFTCPNDILETLRVSVVNQASMVCSMDWKEHNGFFIYNDRWRTRDMDGNLFRGSKSTSPVDEAPPRDVYGGARYKNHLPFQVFCCESGAHVVDPHKSYYEGVTYQSSVAGVFNTTSSSDGKAARWSEGPCMDSSQLHFCRDMWMVSFRDGVKQEAKRLANQERMGKGRNVHPFMEELIQATLASYAPTTSERVGYPNSGDYLADETGAAPGGGPGMDNGIKGTHAGEPPQEPEEEYEEEEGGEGDAENGVVEEYDADAGGEGRPIDLAIEMEDQDYDEDDEDEETEDDTVAAKAPLRGPAAAGANAPAKPPNPIVNPNKVNLPVAPVRAAPGALPVGAGQAAGKLAAAIPVVKKRGLLSWLDKTEDAIVERPVAAVFREPTHQHEKRGPRSLPNHEFDYGVAKILVNPRCVTTYAGVSHTQLALDLFGSGEDKEPEMTEGGKYVLDEWRTPPESFVCQEMRTTGGEFAFFSARMLPGGARLTISLFRRSDRAEAAEEDGLPAGSLAAQRVEANVREGVCYLAVNGSCRIVLSVFLLSLALFDCSLSS